MKRFNITLVGMDSEPLEPFKCPVVNDCGIWGNSWCMVRLVAAESWEWGSLTLEIDGEGAPPQHWLGYELDALGNLDGVLGMNTCPFGLISELETFLLQKGISPGQAFWVEMSYSCSQDYWGEWDSEVVWHVVGMEPRTAEQSASAWEALIGRKHLLFP